MKSLYSVKVRNEFTDKRYSYEYFRVVNLEVLAFSLSFYYLPFSRTEVCGLQTPGYRWNG